MVTVKDRLEIIAKSTQSTDSDSRWMQNVLHAMGFPSAVVVLGIVYLEGKGTLEAPPMSIHSAARTLLKASERETNPRYSNRCRICGSWKKIGSICFKCKRPDALDVAMRLVPYTPRGRYVGYENPMYPYNFKSGTPRCRYCGKPNRMGSVQAADGTYYHPRCRTANRYVTRAVEEDTDYVRKPQLKAWNPIKHIGSQSREPLSESGMHILERVSKNEVILESNDGSGKPELWFKNDHSAGYVVEIKGKGYEFAREVHLVPSIMGRNVYRNPQETCAFCGKPFRSLKTAHLDPVTGMFYHSECWRVVEHMAGKRPWLNPKKILCAYCGREIVTKKNMHFEPSSGRVFHGNCWEMWKNLYR